MAQKTEKEETEFQVPETLTLCVNNCGVTGNPATNNMCQNCFNATTATSTTTTTTTTGGGGATILKFTSEKSSRSTNSPRSSDRSNYPATTSRYPMDRSDRIPAETTDSPPVERRVVNRCSGCRRKVGLTGFRCRCGELFCSEHRYSDRHDCSYDYKTVGREAIARENPVVKAAKIVRV